MMAKQYSLFTIFLTLVPNSFAADSSKEIEFFEKRIRPVLVEHCYRCHSQEKRQRGGLHLDSRAAMLKGGDSGPALVPGDPEKSRLIHAIRYLDPDLKMPPRSKLDEQHIADFVTWIKNGAHAPADDTKTVNAKEFNLEKRRNAHWAFQALSRPPLPQVQHKTWAKSPLDLFVFAQLEAKGLTPTKATDRRTWLRRVTYDLIGLPPTPAEIDAFVNDESPLAYERVVDRLLASPHYGERWARHWLDLVRYAETAGHEFDFEMPMAHEYRDYVIRAFNQDLSYNQFVLEHVAGDLLKNPRRHPQEKFNESIIGTGFFHLGEGKHSPVDIREEEASRVDNQIDVFSRTFLGLTVACARCHDHKFDAISTKDYYALYGYLRSSRYHEADINPPELTQSILAEIEQTSKQATELAIKMTTKSLTHHLQSLSTRLPQLQQELNSVNAAEGRHWLAAWKGLASVPNEQFVQRRRALVKSWKQLQQPEQNYHTFSDFRKQSFKDWFTTGNAFGAEASTNHDINIDPKKPQPVQSIQGPGLATSQRFGAKLEGTLRSPTFTIDTNRIAFHVAGQRTKINIIIDGFQRIRNPIYGQLTQNINNAQMHWRSVDVHMWKGHRAYIECLDTQPKGWIALEQVVFTDGPLPRTTPDSWLIELLDDEQLDSPEKLAKKYQSSLIDLVKTWSTTKHGDILNQLLSTSILTPKQTAARAERRRLSKLIQRRNESIARLPRPRRVMSLVDGTGENEYVFIRGSHKNLGEEVPRRFLEAIAGSEQPVPESGSGRLALAQRMIDDSNPLLARVMVNRLWKHHFGQGIVASVDDFGVQGQAPTHPQLLDWLASEFIREGWSLKKMHRMMVLSSTYRQSNRSTPEANIIDPQNKLLHRMSIRRLEAEAIRDAILSVSGRLDNRMFGQSVMPHLTAHMTGRGRPRRSGPIDGDGRRSVYINVRRNFLTPFFLAFDYPVPFTTIGRRSVSNVPAQALALMNNPFVRQQAELWAKDILHDQSQTSEQRIERLYVTAFGRPPTQTELQTALDFVQSQGEPNDHQTWTALCHVLFNVKEFIFLN